MSDASFDSADFVHSANTARRGTVAAVLLAGHDGTPTALSARWSRHVVSLIFEFCGVSSAAAFSATCRDSLRTLHETRTVPIPAMSAVEEAWVKALPMYPQTNEDDENGVVFPAAPFPSGFDSMLLTFEECCCAAWAPNGWGSITVELFHPVVAAFLENLWIQDQCRTPDKATRLIWAGHGGLKAAALAFGQQKLLDRVKLSETTPASNTMICSWRHVANEIRSGFWRGRTPNWRDDCPKALAGKPVDPATFFQEIFTSSDTLNGSLHHPMAGLGYHFGVGFLWRRDVDPGHSRLPFQWSFVSYAGMSC